MPATPAGRRVVICGAGFGGLWAARTLARADADVLLIDRNNYHTFFPLLYQVAAAELTPSDIAYPVRSILRRSRVRFRMGEITGVDLARRVVTVDGTAVPYDKLILALGSVPNDFGVPGAAEHAFFFRWMHDAIPLREHVLARFERANVEKDPATRRRLLTFVIIGGGPTGVEYGGALAELVYGPIVRDYPEIGARESRIVLIEATDRLLGAMPEHLGAYAGERLRRRGVEVRLGATVERIGATEVRLKGGDVIPTETAVWTAGVKGDPQVARWGLPVGRGGRVPVLPTLQVQGHEEVYVVGDLALLAEGGELLAQVAQVAIQQGKHAAHNVERAFQQLPQRPFHYKDLGVMAVIGRNAAVADIAGQTFRGFPAWMLWLGIHIAWLIGFRNRALVLINWAWNYIKFRSAVRLILPSGKRAESQEADMPRKLVAQSTTTVNAPADRVWEALVTPSQLKQYMFGSEITSDFEPGSKITWKGEWEGKAYQDHGVIKRAERGRVLEYTHFSPMSGQPDAPENYHLVTIELAPAGGGTRVSLSQDNNATEEARAHSAKNWDAMLSGLKKFVEAGR